VFAGRPTDTERMKPLNRTARRVRSGSAVRASEEAGNPPYPGLSLSIGRPSLDYEVYRKPL